MTGGLADWLSSKSGVLDARGLRRFLKVRQSGVSDVIDLASNDYLGLSGDARVVGAAIRALGAWGAGATGSRLVSGTTAAHEELEIRLADWCQQEQALVFSSGYLANVGVVSALCDRDTLIVLDAHSHASLHDAARVARAPSQVFAHNDVAALRTALSNRTHSRALVLTESIFSVLGDQAPLGELIAVCDELDAVLIVDEAHALGVTGDGRGSVAAAGLAGNPNLVVTATLSKALGSQGGVVFGSSQLHDYLVSRARTFMFDTALAPSATAAAIGALDVITDEPWRVARVHEVVARLAQGVGQVPVGGAVLSVPVGDPSRAVAAGHRCLEQGVQLGVFRPPSVPDGVSRLRLAGNAGLDDSAVETAIRVITNSLAVAA